ncbi:MAG: hypothetical protein P4L10_04790 [Acidobacteriaceae bacterium]|nr:hypothetical protein [Acidobacteriaceae bacterium]
MRSLTIVCLTLSACALGQQNNKIDEKATLKMVKEWSTLQTTWGVPESQPISGSSLDLVEISKVKDSDGATAFHYNFKVKGLPQGATYTMEYWPVGGQVYPFQKIASGLKINAEGFVVCSPTMACGDKNQAEHALEVSLKTYKGGTLRFVLTSEKNHKVFVTGIATPFPIRSTDNGCQLEIVRLSPKGEILLLSGSDYPANQDIVIQGNSEGEDHINTVHTDSKGRFQSSELPFVVGNSSGSLDLKITQGADCHPTISVEWGEGSNILQ